MKHLTCLLIILVLGSATMAQQKQSDAERLDWWHDTK